MEVDRVLINAPLHASIQHVLEHLVLEQGLLVDPVPVLGNPHVARPVSVFNLINTPVHRHNPIVAE